MVWATTGTSSSPPPTSASASSASTGSRTITSALSAEGLVGLRRLGAGVALGVVDPDGALLAGRLDAGLEGLDVDPRLESLRAVGDQQGDDGRVLLDAAA